ncbi:hypothetical protein DOTSEDRAFT_174645 [Dothistroma septosporum NZE10]|uniref:Uncharacterized protein n=1 Tax=Dothistroma septosporum (strain NZE10 / CBS 128990) TaxID=675120 RepID=M2WNT8_DOTSN|nr:hypothetical protein DOTSEDRAFT_174645 [Dothistroma septosporum NZE10]
MSASTTTASEHGTRHQLNLYLDWAWTISYWICAPIGWVLWYILLAVLFIIKILYWPVAFLLQPVFIFGRVILNILAAPFRLLVQFQDLYIYLGIAAIVGIFGGLAVFGTYRFLYKVLRLESKSPEIPLRSTKQYREEKQQQQQIKGEIPLLSPRHLSPGALSPGYVSMSDGIRSRGGKRGLLAHTILEEEESDF